RDFLSDLKARGLRAPLLGISDGAPGLIRAFTEVFDQSLRQRCLVHCARNVLAKVPEAAKEEVQQAYWAIFDKIDAPPCERAVAVVRQRASDFAEKYGKLYPAAVKCVTKNIKELTTYLRFPVEHRERIRHTNLLERAFGETRRRVKVIGRLPGETSCMSLVWAVLDRASTGWRGLTMTTAGVRVLQDMRRRLGIPLKNDEVEEVLAA
ncbi:MAG: transposase, partial [Candidatus Limnocylindria bacterium]